MKAGLPIHEESPLEYYFLAWNRCFPPLLLRNAAENK